jgi:outer membrane lipoprotein LolB
VISTRDVDYLVFARLPFRLAATAAALLLCACVTTRGPSAPGARTAPGAAASWEARVQALQAASAWDLAGRVAVAVGTQGWQASLDWHQRGADSEVRLAGPLGVGANVLRLNESGLSIDGAPAGAAALEQLQARLGFELPLAKLRYWVLGVPDPALPFTVERNAEDRAAHLVQADWTIDYDRYSVADGDWLPARFVLTREDVRVRVVVERWRLPP